MENARKLDLRVVLGALALVLTVAAVWAASALAGNGSSPSTEPATSSSDPAAVFVQNEGETEEPPEDGLRQPGDCPEDEGGGGSNGDDPSSGTGTSSDV